MFAEILTTNVLVGLLLAIQVLIAGRLVCSIMGNLRAVGVPVGENTR